MRTSQVVWSLSGAAIGLVAVLCWRDDVYASIPPAAAPRRVESTAFADWLPELRQGTKVTFSDRVVVAGTAKPTEVEPKPGATVETLGPLAEADLQGLVTMLEDRGRKAFETLPVVTDATITFDVMVQAEANADAEEAMAAAQALKNGDYFTTRPGHLPPAPPESGFVQVVSTIAGKPTVVSIVMPFAKYPHFADAWRYRTDVTSHYPATAAAIFNEKPEAWRREAVARLDAIRSAGQTSLEDQEWRRRWFPPGSRLDRAAALLMAQ